MDKIGQRDLLKSISHLGKQSVGRVPSMKEYARDLTTVNSGGTFVMNEGQNLLMTIALLIGITIILNGCAEIFIRVL